VSSGSLRYLFHPARARADRSHDPEALDFLCKLAAAVVESRAAPPAAEPPTEADPLEQFLVRLEAAQLSPWRLSHRAHCRGLSMNG
jgi:hypothetical protein